ncbi:MAG: hypothetical protein ABJC55_20040, partial [Algoriphagus sp.]
MQRLILFVLLLFGASASILAQTDSLLLSNGNLIVGEIKSMDKGVLTIETDYSDSDFKITWGEIKKITSRTNYL